MLRSNFNIKVLRLFNIKRDDGYIISFSDSTVTKINHKKKRFAVYSFNEFLEQSINDSQGDPPKENMDEENESNNSESVEINISDEIEILNNFETRKAEIVINDDEDSSLFIWFSETNLRSQTELKIYERLKQLFKGSIPPDLGLNAMDIPYDEYDININALTIKFQALSENGTFTYNLLEYLEQKQLPEIFKISKNYKKVKKL